MTSVERRSKQASTVQEPASSEDGEEAAWSSGKGWTSIIFTIARSPIIVKRITGWSFEYLIINPKKFQWVVPGLFFV